jgi:hypothetical protein
MSYVRIHLVLLFILCLFESKLAKCAKKCLSDDDVSRMDHGHSDNRMLQLFRNGEFGLNFFKPAKVSVQ